VLEFIAQRPSRRPDGYGHGHGALLAPRGVFAAVHGPGPVSVDQAVVDRCLDRLSVSATGSRSAHAWRVRRFLRWAASKGHMPASLPALMPSVRADGSWQEVARGDVDPAGPRSQGVRARRTQRAQSAPLMRFRRVGSGAPITAVRALLGHQHLATTSTYLRRPTWVSYERR
jgi:hypothetical protein